MAWIERIRIADSRTNFTREGNGKCEREFTIGFAPGELKADDAPSIKRYCKDMGDLVRCEIDEVIGFTNEPREPGGGKPENGGDPATERQVKYLRKLAGDRIKKVLEHYKVEKLTDLTIEQASDAISKLTEEKA